MEIYVVGALLCAVLFAVTGIAPVAGQAVREKRVRSVRGSNASGATTRFFEHSASFVLPFSRFLLAYRLPSQFVCEFESVIQRQGYRFNKVHFLANCVLAVVIAVLLMTLVFHSVVKALLICVVVLLAAYYYCKGRNEKHEEMLHSYGVQIVESLQASLQANMGLEAALIQVSREVPKELGQAFERCANAMHLGMGATEALEALIQETNSKELSFVMVALDIQRKTGGSLRSVFASAQDAMRSQLDLARMLRTKTAQARLSSKIVTAMPFLLLAAISLISEGFVDTFFQSLAGFAVLMVALFMLTLGVLLVRRALVVAGVS